MDFFTTEVLTLKGLTTCDVLFFIHLETRQGESGSIHPHPDQEWMEQQARNMTMEEWGMPERLPLSAEEMRSSANHFENGSLREA
jgi:hypothetical protein